MTPPPLKKPISFSSDNIVGASPEVLEALIACNAVGDVYHPRSRQLLAGCRSSDGRQLLGARDALLQGHAPQSLLAGSNTTIGVVATDMALTKAQAQRLATVGHDGLARAINPVHTMSDGDTLFALGTGQAPKRWM